MPTTIRITPLLDPVIDTIGHDPRSLYTERFWLPTLGPTTLLLLRRLADAFDQTPEGIDLPLVEASRALGLGDREGPNSPLWRSLCRLIQFDLAAEHGDGMAVRRTVPPVNRRHVRRLPEDLQRAHEEWVNARVGEPPIEGIRRNARRLASMLTEAGEDLDCVERALCGAGFHPSICRESAGWAQHRYRQERVAALSVS
ncbi:MAG: hypothetical protein ACRDY7_18660 [Acidimicrobiia bacterium]